MNCTYRSLNEGIFSKLLPVRLAHGLINMVARVEQYEAKIKTEFRGSIKCFTCPYIDTLHETYQKYIYACICTYILILLQT